MRSKSETRPTCVLVVDDEVLVREFVTAALRMRGFDVRVATDGHAAVALVESGEFAPELALVDTSMPGMDGPATLRALRERVPELRAILMSGHTQGQLRCDLIERGIAGYLRKPFTNARLFEQIQSMLVG